MKDDTIVTHAGRHPFDHHGVVNTPVYHASTVLFPTLEAHDARDQPVVYGRKGTPTVFALEEAVSALEGAHGTVVCPSGLAAISTTFLALVKTGDHVLITDNTYFPTRKFADRVLTRYNVEVEYFDPTIGADIEKLIRPETTLIWLESPGSQTFEMTDVPAIVEIANTHHVWTAMDNTWAAGYYFRPLGFGVDVSIQAGTKYIVGHSDAMLGVIACNEEAYGEVHATFDALGNSPGPDDVYLATRGIRTLAVRLKQHYENALILSEWLSRRPEVKRVMFPALPQDPGHPIWRRDFTGASGLFGFVMDCPHRKALAAMMDGLQYFGMGYSWGGYESLLVPTDPAKVRTASEWKPEGQTMRIHVGLEDPDDLIEDLAAGFERLEQAA